jgi:hypothetical protein
MEGGKSKKKYKVKDENIKKLNIFLRKLKKQEQINKK